MDDDLPSDTERLAKLMISLHQSHEALHQTVREAFQVVILLAVAILAVLLYHVLR